VEPHREEIFTIQGEIVQVKWAETNIHANNVILRRPNHTKHSSAVMSQAAFEVPASRRFVIMWLFVVAFYLLTVSVKLSGDAVYHTVSGYPW